MAIFKKAQIGTQQPSLFYDQWAQGNDVKNPDNTVKPLYHGTLSPFNEFKTTGNPDNYFGGNVIYTSNNPNDVSNNYATNTGTDFQQKRNRLIEKIFNEINYDPDFQWESVGVSPDDGDAQDQYVEQEADRRLNVVSPRTLKLYGKMKNPANVTPKNPTWYKSNLYDEDDNEIDDNLYNKIVQDFQNTCWQYDVDPEQATNSVFENLEPTSFNAHDLLEALLQSNFLYDVEDNEGNSAHGDFIKSFFENMGHDGIIMDAHEKFQMPGVTPGTEHHIFFDPKQLKSAIGNTGLYDPQSAVLTASTKIFKPNIKR